MANVNVENVARLAKKLSSQKRKHLDEIDELLGQIDELRNDNLKTTFLYKQECDSRRKAEKEKLASDKQLAELRLCGACRCLGERRRGRSRSSSAARSSGNRPTATDFGTASSSENVRNSKPPRPQRNIVPNPHNGAGTSSDEQSTASSKVLVDQIESLRRDKAHADGLVANLRRQLADSRRVKDSTIQNNNEAIRSLQNELREKDSRIDHLQNSISELQRKSTFYSKVSTDVANLEKRVKQGTESRDDLQLKLNARERDLKRFKEIQEAVQKENCRLNGLVASMADKLKDQKDKIKKLHRSATAVGISDDSVAALPTDVNAAEVQFQNVTLQDNSGASTQPQLASSPDSGFGDRACCISVIEENRRLFDENESLTRAKDIQEERANRLETCVKQLRKQCDQLRSKHAKSADTSTADASRLLSVQTDADRLRRRVEQLESECARRKNNESLLAAQKEAIERRLDDANSRLEVTKAELDQTKRTLAEQSRADMSRPASRASSKRQEADELQRRLAEIERERDRLRNDYNSALVAKQRAESDLNRVRNQLTVETGNEGGSEKGRLLQRIELLHKQLADRETEVTHLKNSLHSLGDDYRRFQASLNEQERNLIKLRTDLSTESEHKEAAERVGESLQAQVNELKRENNGLKVELRKAVDEQDRLNSVARRYIAELATFERLLGEKEREREELAGSLKVRGSTVDLAGDETGHGDDVTQGEADHAAGEHDAQLKLRLDVLQTELDDVKREKEQSDILNVLQTELEDVKREKEQLEAALRTAFDQSKTALAKLQRQLDDKHNENSSLMNDLSRARTLQLETDQRRQEAEIKISLLESELAVVRVELAECQERCRQAGLT